MKTDEAIRERIGQLPPKLEDLYLKQYKKFTKYSAEADRQITRNAFSWLICAQRRLNSTEFLTALSMTPGRHPSQLTIDQVLDMCCNMIVFDKTLDTFRFTHLSVREFLEKRPEFSNTATNSLAAVICLSELLSAVGNSRTERLLSKQGQPLSDSKCSHILTPYSTIYWARHCQLAAEQRINGPLKHLFLNFLSHAPDSTPAFVL